MSEEENLTPTQIAVLEEVNRKLREHFDHSVVLISTEVPVGTDSYQDGYWNGGLVPSLGLLTWAQSRLLATMRADEE